MVEIKPFKAIRPAAKLAAQVAELPYDVVDTNEARKYASGNPYSYFHIDRAEIDLPTDLSPYDPAVYQKAAANLADFLQKGWLFKEKKDCYYLYRLTMGKKQQTGLVVCTAIADYLTGKIKKHESTRIEKEIDRINHIQACDANTSPIFLAFREAAAITALIENWQQTHEPVYDFVRYHEVRHEVWVIDDTRTIARLTKAFVKVPALYIADGHHRTESAVKVGLEKRRSGQASPESEFFTSILFPAEELTILAYNRLIDVPVPTDFFEQVQENFEVTPTTDKKPRRAGQMMMYLDHVWYRLTFKAAKLPQDSVDKLTVSLLQNHVLAPLLGIHDVRTDPRIDFVGGIRGVEALEKRVDTNAATVAFVLYPTQMADLLAVADAKQIMPPKSTWFEPKLLSGLFLHDLETK